METTTIDASKNKYLVNIKRVKRKLPYNRVTMALLVIRGQQMKDPVPGMAYLF